MNTIAVEIVSPEKVLLKRKDITSVMLPGTAGSMGILPYHAPIITSLAAGTIEYKIEGKTESIRIAGGFAEMADNKLIILVTLPAEE